MPGLALLPSCSHKLAAPVRHRAPSHTLHTLRQPSPLHKSQPTHITHAAGPDDRNPADGKEFQKKKFKQDFEKGGINRETAQKIIKVWEETGSRNPDDLRKFLLKRSATTAGVVLLQTLVDAGAAWGGFSTGNAFAAGGDFPGKIILEFLGYFLGLYFTFGVLADFFTLGAVTYSTFQFSTNTKEFMEAVQETAGPKTGVSTVDKARKAVDSVKVILALNSISGILKDKQSGGSNEEFDTLKNLTAFLTLSKAEEKGFKPSDFNLSDQEAGSIATVFSRYDTNDDMMLEQSEVSRLFQGEGYELEPAEVREAIQLLDKNGDGLVSFPEFVDWWCNQVSDDAKKRVEASKK